MAPSWHTTGPRRVPPRSGRSIPATDARRLANRPLPAVVDTPGALAALAPHPGLVGRLLARHARGDWGDVDARDRRANAAALARGERLFSAYRTPDGVKLWVITEADRGSTCVLVPDEY